MSNLYIPHEHIVEYDAGLVELASSFDCGNTHINSFLKSPEALNYGIGKTYVWINDKSIIGFYNITAGSIEEIRGDQLFKIGSAVHINEFAVNVSYQKKLYDEERSIYISDILLSDCVERVEYIRRSYLGLTFITLASTKEGYNLYKRNDFEEMEEDMKIPILEDKEYDCIPMYLPLDIE